MSELVSCLERKDSSFCNYLINNDMERIERENSNIDEKEIWRQIGVMQVIFAARLLRIGKIEHYIARVTGLTMKEIEKIKDVFWDMNGID